MSKIKDRTLKVGESATLKSGFVTKTGIVYGGMPNKDTYSIIVTCTSGYNSSAYNLYFPVSRRKIEIGKRQLDILQVTPDELRLNILKKSY